MIRQCATCNGLVPARAKACPNCVVDVKRGLSVPKTAAFVTLLISTSYCAPVYGAPCTAKNNCSLDDCTTTLPDGGSPKNDSTSECFEPDGGAP